MKLIILISVFFYINSSLAKRVVIIDMPISKSKLPVSMQVKLKEVVNFTPPGLVGDKCAQIGSALERFFSYSLAKEFTKIKTLPHLDKLEKFSFAIHGYHVLSNVMKEANHDFYFLGVRPPINETDLSDIEKYITKELDREFDFISKNLERIKPDYVNISGSETIEENEIFLKSKNISSKKSLSYAKRIYKRWDDFWKKLILANSKTTFVVSAGNGAGDWASDRLGVNENPLTQTTPATVNASNIIVVGSKNKDILGHYSNWGPMVKFFENGDESEGYIPCKTMMQIKLTGTSQATAIHTNKLLKINK